MNQAQISAVSTRSSDYSQTTHESYVRYVSSGAAIHVNGSCLISSVSFLFCPKKRRGCVFFFFFFLLFHDIMATAADWPVRPAFSFNNWRLNRFTKTWIRARILSVVGGRWPAGSGSPGLCLIKGTKNVTRQFSELGTSAETSLAEKCRGRGVLAGGI